MEASFLPKTWPISSAYYAIAFKKQTNKTRLFSQTLGAVNENSPRI